MAADDIFSKVTDHIKDPEIKQLYKKRGDLWLTVVNGEKLLSKTSDQLAVLELMNKNIDYILSDLEEHEGANIELFGGHNANYFKDYKARVLKQIETLKKEGKTSTIFSEFERRYNEASEGVLEEEKAAVRAYEKKATPQDELGDQLGVALSITHDQAKIQEILKTLPPQITSKRLAYNLACYYGRTKDKKNMLKYIELSKSLGKEDWEFKQDADFSAWRQDPDFQKAIR